MFKIFLIALAAVATVQTLPRSWGTASGWRGADEDVDFWTLRSRPYNRHVIDSWTGRLPRPVPRGESYRPRPRPGRSGDAGRQNGYWTDGWGGFGSWGFGSDWRVADEDVDFSTSPTLRSRPYNRHVIDSWTGRFPGPVPLGGSYRPRPRPGRSGGAGRHTADYWIDPIPRGGSYRPRPRPGRSGGPPLIIGDSWDHFGPL